MNYFLVFITLFCYLSANYSWAKSVDNTELPSNITPPSSTTAPSSSLPCTLEKANELALNHSFLLKNAHESLKQAKLMNQRVWVMISPTVNMRGSITYNSMSAKLDMPPFFNTKQFRQDPNGPAGIGWFEGEVDKDNKVKFGAFDMPPMEISKTFTPSMQSVLNWDLINARALPMWDAALLTVLSSESRKEFLVSQVIFQSTAAFYSVLAAKKALQISQKSLKNVDNHLKAAQDKFNHGSVSVVDVLRAEAAVQAQKSAILTAKESLSLALQSLRQITGNHKIVDIREPKPTKIPLVEPKALASKALKQRKDLLTARHQKALAGKMITDVYYQYLPVIGTSASITATESSGFSSDNFIITAMINLSWRIWDGGLREIELKEKQSGLRQAKLAIQELEENIHYQVTEVYINIETLQKSIEVAAKQEDIADRVVENAELLYETGLTDNLQVLDAMTNLANARLYRMARELMLAMQLEKLKMVSGANR